MLPAKACSKSKFSFMFEQMMLKKTFLTTLIFLVDFHLLKFEITIKIQIRY